MLLEAITADSDRLNPASPTSRWPATNYNSTPLRLIDSLACHGCDRETRKKQPIAVK